MEPNSQPIVINAMQVKRQEEDAVPNVEPIMKEGACPSCFRRHREEGRGLCVESDGVFRFSLVCFLLCGVRCSHAEARLGLET